MSDRTNGVAGHQKDKPSAENDAAESAAAPAPSGAEPAGAGAPAPEAAAAVPSDPPELATAATLQQCAPDPLPRELESQLVPESQLHRAPCGARGGLLERAPPRLLSRCTNLRSPALSSTPTLR